MNNTHEKARTSNMIFESLPGSVLGRDIQETFAAEEKRFLIPAYLEAEWLVPQGMWPLDVPRWDGSPLAGKTILLWAEQGFGDMIQYIRYAPMVAELGATVIIACPQELQRLLRTVRGVSKVYSTREDLSSRATYDVHAPMLSLPYIFGATLETIPATVPYVSPPADLVPAQGDGFKIGLVWAGNPKHAEDRRRSMHLSTMLPLLAQPGVTRYSLQVGLVSAQINELGLSGIVQDLGPRLRDFADTASAISQLDLVITVDTSVAHLAGALGRPVWILLPYRADWRWLRDRADSPWYPTARLFRQPFPGDWPAVIEDVRIALDRTVRATGPRAGGITSSAARFSPSAGCLSAQALPCASSELR